MNRNLTRMMAVAGVITLSGCVASTTPQADAHHGEAMIMLKAQQTLDPDASRSTKPVSGLDGKAAKGALDNYRDSFRKPPAEVANPLTIGAGIAGGGR